ncbi:MAG: septum formation initiator family protein [Firmicutes bacterium]|nr:septum formation initiator family protein [Bacillota bacterium]
MTEKALITRIKLITTLCVVIVGALALGVVYTVIKSNVIKAEEAALKQQRDNLKSLQQAYAQDIAFFTDDKNTEEIARKYLGWGKPGETIYVMEK